MGLGAHEPGQERDGLTAGHERQAEDAVVRPMADVGIEGAELSAGAVGDVLPRRPAVSGRPDLAGELGQRHGSGVAARRRMVLGEHDVDGVAVQVLAVDAGRPGERLVLPLVGQDEIEVPERERRERLLGLGLDQLAPQLGRLARERPDRGHGQPEPDRLEGRDPAAPRHPAAGGGEIRLRELRALEQRVGVADQDERGVGQPHAAAGRLQQRHPRLPLEHRELLRDGRRRELQRVGDRGDSAARVQLMQETQPPQVEH